MSNAIAFANKIGLSTEPDWDEDDVRFEMDEQQDYSGIHGNDFYKVLATINLDSDSFPSFKLLRNWICWFTI